MAESIMAYLKRSGVGTTMEFMQLGKTAAKCWEALKADARAEMALLGIEVQ